MSYRKFYEAFFAQIEPLFGPRDARTLSAIVGFDAGGPIALCTFGLQSAAPFTTYVSCELAVRVEQRPASFGRFELTTTCNDEAWARSILTGIGEMSLAAAFDEGHTLDIGAWVTPDAPLQGVVLELAFEARIDDQMYGGLRVIGVTRPELELAMDEGSDALIERLKAAGIHPNTDTRRTSIV